jgi:hypothetical protein
MIYAFLALALVVIAQSIVTAYLVKHILDGARDERRELEDRLMAIAQPVALIQHKATQDNTPAEVTYVGEEREDD